ncbi:hypothetical protein ACJD0Z_04150 [Flavobacteriaceae bacterium M23B6Z8]
MKQKFLILFFLLVCSFVNSCKGQTQQYVEQFNDCTNSELARKKMKTYQLDSFNFMKLMDSVEMTVLGTQKVTKKEYLNFLEKIDEYVFERNQKFSDALFILERNGFHLDGSDFLMVINFCPGKIIQNNGWLGSDNKIEKRQIILERLIDNPENNLTKSLKGYISLLDDSEFQQMEFRFPLILIPLKYYVYEFPER